jgi:hypothetical protein
MTHALSEGSVSRIESIELSNLSKVFSHCDLKEMRKTRKTFGLLSPKQVLEHLTFPKPKEASVELIWLIVCSLNEPFGQKLFHSLYKMAAQSQKGNNEVPESFFTMEECEATSANEFEETIKTTSTVLANLLMQSRAIASS